MNQENQSIIQTRWLPVSLLVFGLLSLFIGERYVSGETVSLVLKVLGGVLACVSLVVSFVQQTQSKSRGLDGQAKSQWYGFLWCLGLVASVGFFYGYRFSLGDAVSPTTLVQKFLLAAWLVLFLVSVFAGIGTELSIRDNGFGPNSDPRRVQRSMSGWALVGVLLCSLVALNYAGAKRDVARDWTYLKTTEPGPSTRSMLKSLDKELTVNVFYPQDNDVLPFVSRYVEAVAREEGKVKVKYLDKDLHPTSAEELKVSRNGQVVLQQGDKRQRIDIGLSIKNARSKLRQLDGQFQKAFLKLTDEQKTIYFTSGHGEMTWLNSGNSPFRSLRIVEKLLREQNFRVKRFNMSSGSATGVPDDASTVVIAGPTRPFLKEEVVAIEEFVKAGGTLMVLLDVNKDQRDEAAVGEGPGEDLLSFVTRMGILFKAETLANEGNYVAATKSPSDKWFLFSSNFTSHESVKNLAKHEESIPLLLFHTGYLVLKDKTGQWKVRETVRSMRETFADTNKNFKHDKGERKKTYSVAAAATYTIKDPKDKEKTEGRVIVSADAHIMSDAVVGAGSPANALFVLDGLKWMIGESSRSGEINSEEDVKIRHKRNENVAYFWGSVAGVPLLILLVGFIATRRRKVR